MKRIVAANDSVSELASWEHARADIWMFHVTHKRLALMLSRQDEPEVLYVVAVGCERMVGPFSWDSSELVVIQEGATVRVVDLNVGFELTCSSITLVKGLSTELDTSFEGFLGDDLPDAPERTA